MCRNFWALLKKFGMLLVEVFNYKKELRIFANSDTA